MDYAYRSSPVDTGFGASPLISFRIDPLWARNKLKKITLSLILFGLGPMNFI
ncbi:MAG: hypothetical protein Ct9H300mP29_9020 [Candidatus Neomarinimicrobiota bacterium]|nr:MAG: hypothetical protein Ct9H300mP29_9020 [Candidatus Neomarinimicrobiota bacterium]